jgi:hypothetical protein
MQHISQVFREYKALKRIESLALDIKQNIPHQLQQKPVNELTMDDYFALALSQKESELLASQILGLVQQILEEN